MGREERGYVQYYARRDCHNLFGDGNQPELLYASWVDSESSKHPRVMHSHRNSVEILLICSGEADFLIGYKTYHVRPGDLIIYNAGVVHDELTSVQNQVSLWCVAVGDLQMQGMGRNQLVREDEGVCFATKETFDSVFYISEAIFNALKSQEPGAEDFAHHLTCALLTLSRHIILRETVGADAEADPEDENILGQRVKEYIDSHYHENINLQTMSDEMHCSKYYLSHVFKDMMGYSPMNYLIKRRIGEAQNLLMSTDIPLVEIALGLGYESQSYFNSQFTKHVGVSPLVYRKKYAHRPVKPEEKRKGGKTK